MPVDAPFDQYQRYRIAAEIAAACRQTSGRPLRVLDVGGHFQDLDGKPRRPIADFVPESFTLTVDLPFNPLSGYVQARGDRLPFADRAFELVVCVDVLEHVPAEQRAPLLTEISRVSGRVIVVAAPFDDPRTRRAEQVLAEFINRVCGMEQGQLKEHRECGLPDLAATAASLERAGWSLSSFPYGNLWRWLLMMIDKHAIVSFPGTRRIHRQLDDRYNLEVFERDRESPCYRHFLVGARDSADPVLAFARQRFASVGGKAGEELLMDLAKLHAANREIEAQGERDRYDAHVAAIDAYRKAQIAELESVLREVERSFTYRLRSLLRKVYPGPAKKPDTTEVKSR